ncbi:salicylate synthase [Antrihabitans sp. YC2-6]|uniref:salicylate synthase n=1 Tax=Antrihabitans sp. YC2-6 TaxID=2799498 RepID=UPI0018F3C5A1|nr:salicylate synthase [Antrihabitans sp. YC2-6]MBJ8346378.1 salicylate synthase [Antrihabitans sp. YC2-6]
MPTMEQQLRIDARVDPLAAVTRLAASGRFAEYVIYERPDEWIFAADPVGSIELDTAELRSVWNGEPRTITWTGRPATVLDDALAGLPLGNRHAYGWVGFEFCAYSYDAAAALSQPTKLAHLIIPRIEVRVTETGATISGGTPAEHDELRKLLMEPGTVSHAAAAPVDIRTDPSGYCDRVAAAVAEIRDTQYEKVILSRRVDVGFDVDMPATYRLARRHNTPARSFLFKLGTLEAAGFSPELVASVDEEGEVTTEPLAGTRAFGRGDAEDLAARIDLESDPKEIVEHAVSVRTSLAEIASVAEAGTAVVSDFMTVRERGSVQHLASTVRGRLSWRRTHWEAFDVLFPSVTASGIPKRESVDAILRLDDVPRGLYSGAVVVVSPGRHLEAALVLRAIYQEDGNAWLRAGAGVIAQSSPEREFEETCEKLSSVSPYVVPAS